MPSPPSPLLFPLPAVVLAVSFLAQAYALRSRVRRGQPADSLTLFRSSISYLTLLFVAVAGDAVLHAIR